MSKQAVMYVSRLLIESLLDGREIDCVADKLGVSYEWLVEVMHLPAGTRMTGVSTSLRFERDEVALRVEHPDFVETIPGNQLPEVQAVYSRDEKNNVVSSYWYGPAVGTAKLPSGVNWLAEKETERGQSNPVKFREFL